MQLYKVKTIDGDLKHPDDTLALYTRGEAIKKSRMFNGKIEKHGIDYTVDECKIIKLAKQEISPAILKELEGRVVFIDTSSVAEEMYYGNVFNTIAQEAYDTIRPCSEPEYVDELTILDNICAEYDYVMIM